MFQPGSSTGDRAVMDLQGKARDLREFRRRSHVVLLWDPSAGDAVVPSTRPEDPAAGTYLISRWGRVIAIHPPGPWDMDRIEHDLLTFEAQDSCGVSQTS